MKPATFVRRSRWIQVLVLTAGAAVWVLGVPSAIGVVAGLGLLVLLPAVLFVDDPRTARGLPAATFVMLASYGALFYDYRPDALGDAFLLIALCGPVPAVGLVFQALCLGVARLLPDARNA